jgi:hypothetical protein
MALNVCNWNDKQLDELVDMLKSADYSAVATFIANNFLCSGSRILTDDTSSNLIATVGTNTKTIVLSAGVFVYASKCSQLDTNQTINILDTSVGSWGTGQAVDVLPRYSIVCIKNNEQVHTAASRWFVDDSVVPNTYYTQNANTLINKAYYDIVVVHGTPAGSPVVPVAPTGYWAIVEIYIPSTATDLSSVGVIITDTTGTSNSTVGPEAGGKNWVATTRVLRMEFWSTKFNVDHDPATGFHREGLWHIGSTIVTTNATEINQALDGIGGTVTAANLTKLTNSSTLSPGELHNHTTLSSRVNNVYSAAAFVCPASWADITSMQLSITTTDVSSFVMLYEGQNVSSWGGTVRFLVDGVAVDPVDGYQSMQQYANGMGINFHGVSLNLAAGTHIFKVQAMRSHAFGSQLSKNQFTVMVF